MSQQSFPLDGFNDLESGVRSITQHADHVGNTRPNLPEKKPETTNASKGTWQHFTFICAVEIVAKIKAIARIEGFSIREVTEKFLRDGIARYEQRHGIVTNRRKSVDDVL